jgi:hypothetical protein
MPCTKRMATSCASVPDTAHSSEPIVKILTAYRNARLRPRLVATQPVSGMTKIAAKT